MRLDFSIAIAVGAFAFGALSSRTFTFVQKSPTLAVSKTKAELTALVASLEGDLKKMNGHQRVIFSRYRSLATKGAALADASKTVSELVEAGGNGQDQLLNATKQMQNAQMSFSLQYLQLQSQMQHENRSYTAASNIMKTRHETAKNMIANIR